MKTWSVRRWRMLKMMSCEAPDGFKGGNIRLVSWNLGGWCNERIEDLREMNGDVFALQETHLAKIPLGHAKNACEKNKLRLLHGPPVIPRKGYIKANRCGVGVISRMELPLKITGQGEPSGMRLESKGRSVSTFFPPTNELNRGLRITSLYAPQQKDHVERESFAADVWDLVCTWDMGIPTVLCGDFNGVSPEIEHARREGSCTLLTRLLGPGGPFVDAHRLLVPELVTWTWASHSRGEIIRSHIDYVLVNRAALPLLAGAGAFWREQGHSALWVELRTDLPRLMFSKPRLSLPEWMHCSSNELSHLMKWDETLQAWRDTTQFKALSQSGTHDLFTISKTIQESIEKLIAIAGGWKKSHHGKPAYVSKSMFKIREVIWALRNVLKELMHRKQPGTMSTRLTHRIEELRKKNVTFESTNFVDMEKEVIERIRVLKKEMAVERCEMVNERRKKWKDKVETLWKTKPGTVYRWLRKEPSRWWCDPMLMPNKQAPRTEQEADLEMRRFWVEGILQKNDPNLEKSKWAAFRSSKFGSYCLRAQWTFSKWTGERVRTVLGEMKEKAAPGHRNIPISLWKCLPDEVMDSVAKLLTKVEEAKQWPDECLKAYVAMLPKTEVTIGPNDYRPITVMDVIYRLWAKGKVLDWQSTLFENLSPGVFGFRADHSGIHLAQLLQDFIVDASYKGKELWLVSFDIRKCYDSIPWWVLFGAMEEAGMPPECVGTFQSFYKDLSRCFRYGSWEGAEWSATNGMAQGCPASPDLLNLIYETFQRWAISQGKGYTVDLEGGNLLQIPAVSFADDLTLIGRCWPEMDELIKAFVEWCSFLGMTINVDKTQVWSNLPKAKSVDINGTRVQLRKTFKVVGIELGEIKSKPHNAHLAKRKDKALEAIERLKALIIPTYMARSLWTTGILPMVTYGAEVVDIKQSQVLNVDSRARLAILSKPPVNLSRFGAIEAISGPTMGPLAIPTTMQVIRRRQCWWAVKLANGNNLAGVVHRAISTISDENGGKTWNECSSALQAMSNDLQADMKINEESILVEKWPYLCPEPTFGGVVYMSSTEDPTTEATVWTDGSLDGDQGGAAAISLSSTRCVALPGAGSSTECELAALALAMEMNPDRILTDSLVSLQLINGWGGYKQTRRLKTELAAEVREVLATANNLEIKPILEKVKAHNTEAINSGDEKAVGNDIADVTAKIARSSQTIKIKEPKYELPVRMMMEGKFITNIDEAIRQSLWKRNLQRLKPRRGWLAAILEADINWGVSDVIFDKKRCGSHITKWVCRLRTGALSTGARWGKNAPELATCRWCPNEVDNEEHILFGCLRLGTTDWREEIRMCWQKATEEDEEIMSISLTWIEKWRWQLRMALIPNDTEMEVEKSILRKFACELATTTTRLLGTRAALMMIGNREKSKLDNTPSSWDSWRLRDVEMDTSTINSGHITNTEVNNRMKWYMDTIEKACNNWTTVCECQVGMTTFDFLEMVERRTNNFLQRFAGRSGVLERAKALSTALARRLKSVSTNGELRWPRTCTDQLDGNRWVVQQLHNEGDPFTRKAAVIAVTMATGTWIAHHPHLQPVDAAKGEPSAGLMCLWESDFGFDFPCAQRGVRFRAGKFCITLRAALRRNPELERWLKCIKKDRPISPGCSSTHNWWSVKIKESAGTSFLTRWQKVLREWGSQSSAKRDRSPGGAHHDQSATKRNKYTSNRSKRTRDEPTNNIDLHEGSTVKRVRSGRASTMDAP
jgi:hypothetical protein